RQSATPSRRPAAIISWVRCLRRIPVELRLQRNAFFDDGLRPAVFTLLQLSRPGRKADARPEAVSGMGAPELLTWAFISPDDDRVLLSRLAGSARSWRPGALG